MAVAAPGAWRVAADQPVARSEVNGVVALGRLWAFSGYGRWVSDGASPRSDAYDPVADTWSRVPDLPRSLTHSQPVALGTDIWVVGGFDGDSPGRSTVEVWRYDTLRGTWSAGPPLPASRGAGATAVLDGRIHYVGGAFRFPGAGALLDRAEHWALDPGDPGAGWRRLADLPTPRNHVAGATLDGRLYVLGGQHGNDELTGNSALVERYDAARDTWERVAPLPVARGHITSSTFVAGGRIVVVGGTTDGSAPSAAVTAYDPARDAWETLTPLPAPREAPVAGELGGRIVVTGGYSTGGGQTSTWIGPRADALRPAGTAPAAGGSAEPVGTRAPGPGAATGGPPAHPRTANAAPVCAPAPRSRRATRVPARSEHAGRSVAATRALARAALTRITAAERRLAAGLRPRDLCGGGVSAADLAPGVVTTVAAPVPRGAAAPRPLRAGDRLAHRLAPIAATPRSVGVNRRLVQTAALRVTRLERRLDGRLTSRDLAPGAVTARTLAPGLVVVSAGPAPAVAVRPRPVRPVRATHVSVTAAGMRRDHLAAVRVLRRAEAVVTRLERGLDGRAFRDGAIGGPAVAATG